MVKAGVVALGTVLCVSLAGNAAAQELGAIRWDGRGDTFGTAYEFADGDRMSTYAGSAYRASFKINSAAPYLPPHSATAFGPTVDIYCIDFLHTANTSSSGYSAYFTRLGTDPLTNTRNTDATKYLQSAWLITQMNALGYTTTDRNTRADIHGAIWNIMSGEPVAVRHGTTYSSTGLQHWLDQATTASNWASIDSRGWTVVTAACVTDSGTAGAGGGGDDRCSQEFLTTATVTPEPALWALMATGLLALFGVARWRTREQVERLDSSGSLPA